MWTQSEMQDHLLKKEWQIGYMITSKRIEGAPYFVSVWLILICIKKETYTSQVIFLINGLYEKLCKNDAIFK